MEILSRIEKSRYGLGKNFHWVLLKAKRTCIRIRLISSASKAQIPVTILVVTIVKSLVAANFGFTNVTIDKYR